MKTIKEWLEELPEPYRTQAIENTSKERLQVKDRSVKEALLRAFDWGSSLQKFYYWNDLYETL